MMFEQPWLMPSISAIVGGVCLWLFFHLRRQPKGPIKKTERNKKYWAAVDLLNRCRTDDLAAWPRLEEYLDKHPGAADEIGMKMAEKANFRRRYNDQSAASLADGFKGHQ